MSFIDGIISNLPEVAGPTQKRLSFKEKLKWTLISLVLFFVMSTIPLYGLSDQSQSQFAHLSMLLGASFGSIMSLGIGPIVTASIVLQLLNGSGIIKFDLQTSEGKRRFQGIQKILAFFFIIFEAAIYVFMGGLPPPLGVPNFFELQLLLIFQVALGGILVLFMDEVVSKWGFGSGISLFIAAGVSQQIFIGLFSPLKETVKGVAASEYSVGAIPQLFQALTNGAPDIVALKIAAIISTCLVFAIAVYTQAMKIEIPLSFGRVRGQGIRWPLSFIYTSNIPVILVAALLANVQLWTGLLENWGKAPAFLGNLVLWVQPTNIVAKIINGSVAFIDVAHSFVYMIIMVIGCVIFSILWVQTSGMDAKNQAKKIMSSGLQIPGFRRDPRILERVLQRYIGPLTVMGAIAIGILAGVADVSGAIGSGTGILLTVMIIYRFYEDISKQHMMDMNPMMRKFMQ
jgi:preprotein translocase subunit SecY